MTPNFCNIDTTRDATAFTAKRIAEERALHGPNRHLETAALMVQHAADALAAAKLALLAFTPPGFPVPEPHRGSRA